MTIDVKLHTQDQLRLDAEPEVGVEDQQPAVAVAYLVSQYPKLSHEFIAREIRALRAAGARVVTFSVRPTPPAEIRSAADQADRASTIALLEHPGRTAAALLRTAFQHPFGFLRVLRVTLATGRPTFRRRLWQIFYLAEAALLVEQMRAAGLTHVHVHFANNGADVARSAMRMADAIGAGPWTWSMTMHGPTEFADVPGSDLANKVRSAAFVSCISDYCRSQLMYLVEPRHWDKLHVVPMTVDPSRYPDVSSMRRDREPGPLRVLFVGRLVAQKGPQLLLDAVAGIDEIEVRIVGDGPLMDDLVEAVSQRDLADRVSLVGPVGQDDLPAHYAWADTFCLPSLSEGLPVVLMEAMATGLPVITTQIAGIPELVQDGISGTVVRPGRVDLLRESLGRLADDRSGAIRLGEEAAQQVRRGHDPQLAASLMVELFADVTSSERGR